MHFLEYFLAFELDVVHACVMMARLLPLHVPRVATLLGHHWQVWIEGAVPRPLNIENVLSAPGGRSYGPDWRNVSERAERPIDGWWYGL
jgi:hypothetical protein